MRNPRRRSPRVESLEHRPLLSAGVGLVAPRVMAALVTQHRAIHLDGSFSGSYTVHLPNPDIGKTYTFHGVGKKGTPFAGFTLSGSIHTPGFIGTRQRETGD